MASGECIAAIGLTEPAAGSDLRAMKTTAVRDGDDARFFASHEHFWIGRLCNHWSAGVLNAAGNVLGMMPHPERAVDETHGGTHGRGVFESLLGKAG